MAEYKAKRHSILDNLKSELLRGFLKREYMVANHKFSLSTLNDEEETWADAYMRPTNMMATISSRKAPRLACAIKAIDDVDVERLFTYPDDMPKDIKASMEDNPIQKKFWIRDQVFNFLSEETNRSFVNELFEKFNELEKERDGVIKELPKQ